ncbi:hypothetical protein [Shouchella lehensis]|uniref:Uncharacterized protein n=2 Tax=Shouchella lehensis TaxID=300825 RepID=A0A060LYB2_9BACI|nr:hypothetical protein [Shouchella lehensis]AIC96236.1 hypothetical protein BleG1_3689 [Shouchella lehensis G1]MBG9785128.1 hypothetical protein [Shouchella lehensis]TES46562.1 hypothetical protein E2L03_17890 [Shouchella lehensis]
MKTPFTIRVVLRLVSVLFGVMVLAACTTPESSPAPANPNDSSNPSAIDEGNAQAPVDEEENVPYDEIENELSFSAGNDTKILSAQAVTAPFDATYIVPEGMDVLANDHSLTFTNTPDLPYHLQVSVRTESLPSDFDLAQQRDYTSLSLRSTIHEPSDIDLERFPELPFDYYYTIQTTNETIHRLVRFDEQAEHMYIATLNTPESREEDPNAYAEVVSLFHAILSSANDQEDEVEVEADTDALLDKLQDRSSYDENDQTFEKEQTVFTALYEDEEFAFSVDHFTLFNTFSIYLPEGYQKRSLGEHSYSFTNREDADFQPITLIIGLTHPDIPLDLHISALRSANEELSAEAYPMFDFFDYVFVEMNEDDTFKSATLIKEREDQRIFEASIRTSEEYLDELTFIKLMTALLEVEDLVEEVPVK